MLDFQKLNRERLVLLTVVGRKSGKPHTVKIWFAAENGKVFVTSARGMDAQWVKNLRKTPAVTVKIGETTFQGTAVWREDDKVRTEVIPLFLRKYFLAKVFKWIGWYSVIFAFEITPEKTEDAEREA
jgi:deazaflavin-dependent oxidoreductase (nitroreductase family)